MKSGLSAIWIGITFLILLSCAISPEPEFNPEIADIRLPESPEEPSDAQAESSSPANPSESGDSDTEGGEVAKSGPSETGAIPKAAQTPEIEPSGITANTEKVKNSSQGAAEAAQKPESSKPRLKGFSEKTPATDALLTPAKGVPDPLTPAPDSSTIPIPPGTAGSGTRAAADVVSTVPPPNPLLMESRPLQSSAVKDTGDDAKGSQAVGASASGGPSGGVPAKPAASAAVTPGTPVPATKVAPSASAAPAPATTRAPAPAAAGSQNTQVFTNPLKDPATAAAAPSRLLDSPGEFTITLAGQGWIFRSDLSTPGSWRFLERIRKGESTGFRFLFTESGEWSLVFERQDPASGGSERQTRIIRVRDDGGTTVVANGPIPQESVNPISGELPMDSESRNIAAEEALALGDIDQALEFWERDASNPGESGRRARKAIVETASRSGSVGPLIAWMPAYMKDGADPEILAAALKVFESQAGYDKQSMAILDVLTIADQSDRRPEWLYRQASILEKPGPDRDLDRAAMLYQQVITQWPLSPWRDLSEERLLWLKRHYFRVR